MSVINLVWNAARNLHLLELHRRALSAQALSVDPAADPAAARAPGPASRTFAWLDREIALGGVRQDFLPEDRFDRQPLWNSARSACLIADVRLDDRAALSRELGLVHPGELADSDLLLAAWERWGSGCVHHLVGAYAFAVWNPVTRQVFAARDPTGQHLLYFHHSEQIFALASSARGLLALPGVFRGFDERRVADSIAYLPYDWRRSFFAGVEELPRGHVLLATPSGVQVRRYWDPADAKPVRFQRDEQYAEALTQVLDRATEARLRTTGGIGSHLSGGLDSTSVAASAAILLRAQGRRLTAFTSIPRPGAQTHATSYVADESAPASEVARLYPNIDHLLVHSAGYQLMPTLARWAGAMDSPALNALNFLWISAILDQARERGLTVMLQGNAGNSTISWESLNLLSLHFRGGRWARLLREGLALRRRGMTSYRGIAAGALFGLLPEPLMERLRPPMRAMDPSAMPIHPALAERFDVKTRNLARNRRRLKDLRADRSLVFGITNNALLRSATRALWGIDVRDPTEDQRVYEFCFGIPLEQYIVGGTTRSLVRRAMRGRLPETILNHRVRGLQGADWAECVEEAMPSLRQELSRLEGSQAARSLLDLAKLRRFAGEWDGLGPELEAHVQSLHLGLTSGVAMGYFLRTWEERMAAGG